MTVVRFFTAQGSGRTADDFFDHFLLGKPRSLWMENTVPYLDRGKRDIDALYKGPEAKPGGKKINPKACPLTPI
jgi:hypothetical protein